MCTNYHSKHRKVKTNVASWTHNVQKLSSLFIQGWQLEWFLVTKLNASLRMFVVSIYYVLVFVVKYLCNTWLRIHSVCPSHIPILFFTIMTYDWILNKHITGLVPLVQQELLILPGRYLLVFVLFNHQFYSCSIYLFIFYRVKLNSLKLDVIRSVSQ